MLLFLVCFVCNIWLVFGVQAALNVSDVVNTIVVASRTQRDISMLVPIGQTNNMGVSLNTVLFEKVGYNSSSLDYIRQLLDGGLQTWMLDLYYNNATSNWQLCPAPFPQNSSTNAYETRTVRWNNRDYHCQPSFTLDLVMQEFRSYFMSTNTNIAVNLIQIMFNLYDFDFSESKNKTIASKELKNYATFSNYGNSTLNSSLSSVSDMLYTPQDLTTYQKTQSGTGISAFYNTSAFDFPLSQTFLLNDYKRLITYVAENKVPKSALGSNDENTIFFNEDFADISYTSDESLLERCGSRTLSDFNKRSLNSNFRTVMDNENVPFPHSSFRKYVTCGYSPILNASRYSIPNKPATTDISDILTYYFPRSYWSWAPGQPHDRQHTANTSSFDKRDYKSSDNQMARKCVTLQESGFVLSNCYEEHKFACQKFNSPNEWKISVSSDTYFSDDYGDCPEGYLFNVPQLSIEVDSLRQEVANSGEKYPIWVDLNDITVANCFVTGGPYAQCPYQRTVSGRRLVELIAPSFVVALVIVVLIFIEKIFRVNPVQTNRKRYWRRAINEYNKQHGYEGVPS